MTPYACPTLSEALLRKRRFNLSHEHFVNSMVRRPLQEIGNSSSSKRTRPDTLDDDGVSPEQRRSSHRCVAADDSGVHVQLDSDDEYSDCELSAAEDEPSTALNNEVLQLEAELQEMGEEGRAYGLDRIIKIAPTAIPTRCRLSPLQRQKPIEWLYKAQEFLFEWSILRGISRARIDEIRTLQLPQRILQHCEPLLRRMLRSFLLGTDLIITNANMQRHLGNPPHDRLDGVYVRFGFQQADEEGSFYGSAVCDLLDDETVVFPRFHYIGESNDMHVRTISHDIRAFTNAESRYRWDRLVKAVAQLPLYVVREQDVNARFSSMAIRRLIEGILIAAFGSCSGAVAEYDELHEARGLRTDWYPGTNAKTPVITANDYTSKVKSIDHNPSLRPFYGKLVNAYLAKLRLQWADLQHKAAVISIAEERLEEAKEEYMEEKGRLLLAGDFVAVTSGQTFKRPTSNAECCLNNLFAVSIRPGEIQALIKAGIATEFITGRYSFKLRLREVESSTKDDFYVNAIPDNRELTKGIQLVAHNSNGAEGLIASVYGGPRYPLTDLRHCLADHRTRADRLMRFLMATSTRSQDRLALLASRPLPWWKQRENAKSEGTNAIIAGLSDAEVQMLDGSFQCHHWLHKGSQRFHFADYRSGNSRLTLLSMSTQDFLAQNPQCYGDNPIYCRVNLQAVGERSIRIGHHSGIRSEGLPFAMQVWTWSSGWNLMHLRCLGGHHLFNVLSGIAKKYSMPFLTQDDTPPPMAISPQAPDWIVNDVYVRKNNSGGWNIRLPIRQQVRQSVREAETRYYVYPGAGLARKAMLEKDEPVQIHIEFWDHADAEDYRLLLLKQGQTNWYEVPMPSNLRNDLRLYRARNM